jgi:hypothetical protein
MALRSQTEVRDAWLGAWLGAAPPERPALVGQGVQGAHSAPAANDFPHLAMESVRLKMIGPAAPWPTSARREADGWSELSPDVLVPTRPNAFRGSGEDS